MTSQEMSAEVPLLNTMDRLLQLGGRFEFYGIERVAPEPHRK